MSVGGAGGGASELHAWRDGEHVGVFIRRGGGGLVELHYDTAEVPALSLSMPNGAPIAREHGTGTDVFELLQHVGADVAGAVSLLPAGREPGDAADQDQLPNCQTWHHR